MALAETTTLRVPVELRDEIAALADSRGTTMLQVVVDAVEELRKAQWWGSLHEQLDAMGDDDAEGLRAEVEDLDGVVADGLRDR